MNTIILDLGPDVKGESTRDGFAGKMDVLSFSHGVAMQVTDNPGGSGRATGRPSLPDMSVTKYLDGASPVLNQSCCAGRAFARADLIVGQDDQGPFAELMRYTMKNVLISSVSVGWGGDGNRPVETLTLNCTEIAWHYDPQGPGGGVRGSWNLKTNHPG